MWLEQNERGERSEEQLEMEDPHLGGRQLSQTLWVLRRTPSLSSPPHPCDLGAVS